MGSTTVKWRPRHWGTLDFRPAWGENHADCRSVRLSQSIMSFLTGEKGRLSLGRRKLGAAIGRSRSIPTHAASWLQASLGERIVQIIQISTVESEYHEPLTGGEGRLSLGRRKLGATVGRSRSQTDCVERLVFRNPLTGGNVIKYVNPQVESQSYCL
jgi:hypothetical protein